jgi:hypothetical protein
LPAWDQTQAIARLRSALSDLPTDKFIFRQDVVPEPDGTAKVFFTGDTRLVSGSLQVFKDGVLQVSGDFDSGVSPNPDYEKGQFALTAAPPINSVVQASYNFQWWFDPELIDFLTNAANTLSIETAFDAALPMGARPVVLSFAAYYAYMYKAAEYADALVVTSEGYQADRSKSHPNWRAMAQQAWETAQKQLELFASDPLKLGGPAIKLVHYRLPSLVPRS